MLLLKLMSDAVQAVMAWPAFAFDVRITREFVAMIHRRRENTVDKVQYHPTMLTRRGHFSKGQWTHAACCRTFESLSNKGKMFFGEHFIICDSVARTHRSCIKIRSAAPGRADAE